MINISQYSQVFINIPIEPILNVNTFLTKMFHVKHIEYQRGAAKHPPFHPGMESRGNTTITHDGHTTSSEILGINPEALRAEFKEFRQQFITERLAEGASMEEADAESKEIEKEAHLTKEKLKAARRESQERIEKIVPQRKILEDEINNLYAAIYDEETSAQQIVAFIDEVKQSTLRIEKIVEEQKAKITKGMKLSERVNKLWSE